MRSRSGAYSLLIVGCCAGLLAKGGAAQTVMTFGVGEVTLPSYFERYSDPDSALAAVSKPHENVRLFLDFHKADDPARSDLGEIFVREQAKTKGAKIREMPGKVVLLESGKDSLIDGRRFANLHWQIGFGNSVVVMTATIAPDAKDLPDVKQFFSGDISQIILSLRRTPP